MKISPKIYAKTLVESASSENLKQISRNFWIILQKNKQYRELGKILESIDEEAAARDGKILAKVYSKEKLDEKTLEDIKTKLSARYVIPEFPLDVIPDRPAAGSGIQEKIDSRSGSHPVGNDNIVLKNIIGKNITGFVVKVGDQIIDLTAEDKINRLKKVLG